MLSNSFTDEKDFCELRLHFWKLHTKSIHPKLVICNWLVYDKMEKLIRKMEK